MIVGIGTDICEVERIGASIRDYKQTFLNKIFTAQEIEYCSKKAFPDQHYAARFAAKEALSKAMRTGWSGNFRWRDVEVKNEASGAPKFHLHGETGKSLLACKVHLTLSHTEKYAQAFVIVEK
jgi:holo-[acyl-carrier protein] synthase